MSEPTKPTSERMVDLRAALVANGIGFHAINLVGPHIDLRLQPQDVDTLTRVLLENPNA